MSNIDPKDLLISPVKREKAKKKAKLERKIQMRADMPVLDRYQIRRSSFNHTKSVNSCTDRFKFI